MTLLLGTAWILFVLSCLASMAPPLRPPTGAQTAPRSRPARHPARHPARSPAQVVAASMRPIHASAQSRQGASDETS